MEDHICHVDIVLTILSGVQLKAHPGKSIFGCRGMEYLGHYISSDGLSPAEAKTQAFQLMRPPTNRDEIKIVMGLFNYYRGFVSNFYVIAQPINKLLRSENAWEWGGGAAGSLQGACECLMYSWVGVTTNRLLPSDDYPL